jgi:opacity protein-like surface antigen
MKSLLLTLLLLLVGLPCVCGAETIPVIVVNNSGEQVVAYTSVAKYQRRVTEQLTLLQSEAIDSLTQLKTGSKFKIHTLALGVAVDLELGLPYLITLGIIPRFDAIFSNRKNPIIP